MKKLITLLLIMSTVIITKAQVTQSVFDFAWQRQFTLNQTFGRNDSILFANNGDRRRQIESLQRDSIIKTAQIASLKADSVVKTKQILDLTTRLNNLTNLVNTFTNRTVIVEGKVEVLEKAPKDTFTFGKGFVVDAKKQIVLDSVAISTVINKIIEANLGQIATNYLDISKNILDISKILEANDTRTKKIEVRLEDVISRVIILEVFKTAIQNL